MLEVRPIVVADGIVVGGNMRLLAMKELGFREVTAIDVTDWTQGQRDEFMIKDNLNFGDWDYDLLANEWEGTDLEDWGLDLWQDNIEEPSFEELQGENKDKAPSIKITFVDAKQLSEAQDEISNLINKYEGAYISLSAGEL